ncbi:uncharacterized protein LOC110837187 [Zootermopsis nevadensis]|uniref:Uncharacterized protein n=1 Tax=Zootermopsis nevadensis TaxID=136037 RepID=A0A067R196_ZOONE|nr:uncharacterized protein LOC110837187 [Zootermopsis nevadensis]KDR11341.1 hypothetical protein L798_14883 [Zootermopsis nevadensis]
METTDGNLGEAASPRRQGDETAGHLDASMEIDVNMMPPPPTPPSKFKKLSSEERMTVTELLSLWPSVRPGLPDTVINSIKYLGMYLNQFRCPVEVKEDLQTDLPKEHSAWMPLLEMFCTKMAMWVKGKSKLIDTWNELQKILPQQLAEIFERLATTFYTLGALNEQRPATSPKVTKSPKTAEKATTSTSVKRSPSLVEIHSTEPEIAFHEIKALIILSEAADVIAGIMNLS